MALPHEGSPSHSHSARSALSLPVSYQTVNLSRFFLLQLLGWHWLIKLYRFQVYKSTIQHWHGVFTTQSQISFHCHIFGPLYPLLPSQPLPLFTTIPLSLSTRFCLFFLFVHLLLSVLYLTYGWNHMVLDFFCLTYPYFAQYNVYPCFCVFYTQNYYTHGMQSLRTCIMCILLFPSKNLGKKVHIIHGKIQYIV